MEISTILLWVCGAVIVFFLLRYLIAAQLLLGMVLQQTKSQVIPQSDCPDFLRDLYAELEPELTSLGFQFSHCQLTKSSFYRKKDDRYYYVYYHPLKHSYAFLTAAGEAETFLPGTISFTTYFQNGQRLSTLNGLKHTVFTDIPGTILQDGYVDSLEKQWRLHTDYLEKHPELEIKMIEENAQGNEELALTEQKANESFLFTLLEKKWIFKIAEDRYLIKTIPAVKFASRLLKGMSDTSKMKNKLRAKGKRYNLPAKLEAENYCNSLSMINPETVNNYGKFAFLCISAVLFILAFGFIFSFQFALILFGAVLIHEVGHALMMFLTGYKNIKLLFIPMFGAAAMGSDQGVKPYKRVLTYFAGPVPGILLGFFGLWLITTRNMPLLSFSDAFSMVAILLFLNYFNLLPVMPFDGGQILNTIIFSRYSILQFIFVTISIVAMLILGVKLHEPVFLILSILLVVSYQDIFSRSKVISKLKNRYPDIVNLDETETRTRIFETLKEAPHDKLEFRKKFMLAKFVEENVNAPKAALPTIILTLVFYAALFIAPVYYFISTNSIFYRAFKGSKYTNPCEIVSRTRLPLNETASPSRFERVGAELSKDFKPITHRSCFKIPGKKNPEQENLYVYAPPHADFLSRLWTLYGKPDSIKNGFSYTIRDKKTNLIFTAYIDIMHYYSYGGDEYDMERLIPSLYLFEKLIKETPRSDCRIELDLDYSEITNETGFLMDKESVEYMEKVKKKWIIGCKDGVPFFEDKQDIKTGDNHEQTRH